VEVRSSPEVHVVAGERGELRDARPRFDREVEQCLVAPSGPGVEVAGGKESVDLLVVACTAPASSS